LKQGKIRFTLGKKIVLLTLLMCTILCAVSVYASYSEYSLQMNAYLKRMGGNLTRVLASQITADDLDHYYETQKMDDRYYQIQNFILDLADNNDVKYLYIVRPNGVGVTFLFDSDLRANENGDYYAGGNCSLGTYVDLEGQFAENLDRLLAGKEIDPIVAHDSSFGWLMTISYPVTHEDGTMAGYIMVDISMNEVVANQRAFLLHMTLLLSLLTLGVMAAYLVFVRKTVIRPIRQLTSAAQAYEGGENKASFSNLKFKSRDELQTLADAFRMMLVEIDLHGREQTELAVREERVESELRLATEINAAMLPKSLPEPEGGLGFAVQGRVEQLEELGCGFYDYYLLDHGRLCLVMGEVLDKGMSAALFMVVAQTTVKSQMRSGLPLTEAMTAANRQLYEIGGDLALSALVGVLSQDGTFSYINAGQRAPLLMRDQDRYDWLKGPVYAPLGQNENVVYQIGQVSVHQGDRLFFHTVGLDDIEGEGGRLFGEQKLQTALNVSRGRDLDLDGLLEYMGREGRAYARRPETVRSFAMAALEYRRSSRNLAHCTVPGNRKGAAQVTEFLKRQLGANGLSRRAAAEAVVLADELFNLCCWTTAVDRPITVEFAMAPGNGCLTLRMKGSFGGKDPMLSGEGDIAANAVRFIRSCTEQLSFEKGELQDVLTVEKLLDGEARAESERRS
jgi:sigma-B regulation protein RsbU (phosphoserine phosphatase)